MQNRVTINGLQMAYKKQGQGRPLVLVHGWPTSSYIWRAIIKPLSEHFTVYAPDLIGFGDSDSPEAADYSAQFHSEYLGAFCDTVGLKKFSLVVHDIGGPSGLLWALSHPERIDRLLLLSTITTNHLSFYDRLLIKALNIPGLREILISLTLSTPGLRAQTGRKGKMSPSTCREHIRRIRRGRSLKQIARTIRRPLAASQSSKS